MKPCSLRSLAFLLLLSALVSSGATVQADSWDCGINAFSWYQDSGTMGCIGVNDSAVDGRDGWDGRLVLGGPRAYLGTYHEAGQDGWQEPSGFYTHDTRAPLSPGESKVWPIYVWADPSLATDATTMWLYWLQPSDIPDGLSLTIALSGKPAGETGGPAIGTVWDLLHGVHDIEMPVYRTTDGRTGYVFDITAAMVPEPSSLLALGAGGLALLGSALRLRVRG